MLSREEWLEERRNHVGASDVWKILLGRQLEVYEAKVTGYSQSDNKWMRMGRKVEGAIADEYEYEAGRAVEDRGATTIVYHPDIPFLGATLDRETMDVLDPYPDGPWVPLECKNIGNFTNPKKYQEDPDVRHQIQLQIQMACMNSTWGSLAALFPGYNLVWRDIERNDDFLETVYPELENFWRHVVDKIPPPVESHRDLKVIKRLYPADSGETVVLDSEVADLVYGWEVTKHQKKEKEESLKRLEATIRSAMGDATWGALPDGTFLSLKTTKRKKYTREIEAGEYRTLRRTKVKK
jgi:predicted phage-related endonuclease